MMNNYTVELASHYHGKPYAWRLEAALSTKQRATLIAYRSAPKGAIRRPTKPARDLVPERRNSSVR
jgi:hypothetical protein